VIFVETSAFAAIMLKDKEIDQLIDVLDKSDLIITGAHVRLEVCMVVASRLNLSVQVVDASFQKIIDDAAIEIEPLTDKISIAAVKAFSVYGKGQKNKAQLNLADCLSYAYCKSLDSYMLFVGNDFSHTDLKIISR
jgi:ribonuclease VapC